MRGLGACKVHDDEQGERGGEGQHDEGQQRGERGGEGHGGGHGEGQHGEAYDRKAPARYVQGS